MLIINEAMNPFLLTTIILGSIIVLHLLMNYLIVPLVVGRKIYEKQMRRKNRNDWGHVCSCPTNYEQMMMWNEGWEWANSNIQRKKDVHILSEGYNLYGEYFDFGKKKAVIIVPGRTESLCYSYFYAPSYEKAGYNVLVIDKRAHGLSDGEYEDGGKHSSIDIINWAKMLHDDYAIEDIALHGVCLGAAICAYALARKECPPSIKRFISDGMYTTFYVTFHRHMKEDRRPTFPYCYFALANARRTTKSDLIHDGPIYIVDKIKVPTLFIFTTLDNYSLKEDAENLFAKCSSPVKKLRYFNKGVHSHVRYNNKEEYDEEIKAFDAETDSANAD